MSMMRRAVNDMGEVFCIGDIIYFTMTNRYLGEIKGFCPAGSGQFLAITENGRTNINYIDFCDEQPDVKMRHKI